MNQLHFREYQAEFFRLYEAEEYQKAEAWIRILGGLFPERAAVAYNWRMCLAVRLEQHEKALDLFQEALDLGLWWPPALLWRDPDLVALRTNPRYQNLLETCSRLQAEARQNAQPTLFFHQPPEPSGQPGSLALLLHGRSENGREMLDDWSPLVDQGWLAAAAQSSQMLHAGAYCWDDLAQAEQDVLGLLDELNQSWPNSARRLLFAGFGQGADLAIRLALSAKTDSLGFLAVAPSPHHGALLPVSAPATRRSIRKGYLVLGGQDPAAAYTSLLEESLRLSGIEFQVENHPDLDHTYPPRFAETLQRAVDYFNA